MIYNEIKIKWTDYLMKKMISYFELALIDIYAIYYDIADLIYNMKSKKEFINYFKKYISENNVYTSENFEGII
jgi:hypothetical protein